MKAATKIMIGAAAVLLVAALLGAAAVAVYYIEKGGSGWLLSRGKDGILEAMKAEHPEVSEFQKAYPDCKLLLSGSILANSGRLVLLKRLRGKEDKESATGSYVLVFEANFAYDFSKGKFQRFESKESPPGLRLGRIAPGTWGLPDCKLARIEAAELKSLATREAEVESVYEAACKRSASSIRRPDGMTELAP